MGDMLSSPLTVHDLQTLFINFFYAGLEKLSAAKQRAVLKRII
jgi:hypothetical protein